MAILKESLPGYIKNEQLGFFVKELTKEARFLKKFLFAIKEDGCLIKNCELSKLTRNLQLPISH
jgi:hypothetical protein